MEGGVQEYRTRYAAPLAGSLVFTLGGTQGRGLLITERDSGKRVSPLASISRRRSGVALSDQHADAKHRGWLVHPDPAAMKITEPDGHVRRHTSVRMRCIRIRERAGQPKQASARAGCGLMEYTAPDRSLNGEPMRSGSGDHRYCRCGTQLAHDNSARQCARCEQRSRDKLIAPPRVPTEFWETDQFHDAFAAQHMGLVSRAYRTHPYHHAVYGPRGVSQALLGEWIGLRQPHVNRIENGPPIVHLDTLQHWARVLRIPPRLLWFRLPEDNVPTSLSNLPGNDRPGFWVKGEGRLPILRWFRDLIDMRQAAAALWEYALEHECDEDTHGTSLNSLMLRWLIAPSNETVLGHDGWPRVGLSDVQRLDAIRQQLKTIDDAYGGTTAFPMAVAYLRREVVPLLRGQYDDVTGRALTSAIARLQLDVGWMAYDAGNCALAWRYMLQALQLSHAVDDRLFGARVLAAMSHQALHLAHLELALDLVLAAREGVKQAAPPKVLAMLAAMEACAQAAIRQSAACANALGRAERAMDQVADDAPDWLDFGEGGLRGHEARALRDLQQSRAAAHHAEASLALCQNGHHRTRAQRNAILATAQLQLGDVDAAAATGLQLVDCAQQLRSGHVDDDLASLVHTVAANPSKASDDFLHQARELLAGRRP